MHSCAAVLSGTVQTWKWVYINSHPGYCYCVRKSSQSVSFPFTVRGAVPGLVSEHHQQGGLGGLFGRDMSIYTNQVWALHNSRNNMSSASDEFLRVLYGQVCFLSSILILKTAWKMFSSLLWDENTLFRLITQFIISIHPIRFRVPALHYAMWYFLMLFTLCN